MLQLPLVVTAHIDVLLLVLSALSLWTRLSHLSSPRAVVFDEVYYGQFVSLYMKRVFFVDDSGPVLGHMILALGAYLGGFDGNFAWNRIGAEYPSGVCVWSLRLIPAICGALCVPLGYLLTLELHCSHLSALGAAVLLLLENSLIVQSRFMLLESVLIFFLLLALYSYLRFHNGVHSPTLRYAWLLLCGVCCGAAVGVKYTGVFSYLLLLGVASLHTWNLIGDRTVSHLSVCVQCVCRAVCLLLVPVLLYVFWFYIHLSLLKHSGPHDQLMSPAFQSSLQGGLSRITRGQPMEVAYGSQVTLRSSASQPMPCWLNSHRANYPIRYENGRGSSHQQQVACSPSKDVNNWWIIKDPHRRGLTVDRPPRPVRHGDVIQLVHGTTSRLLNSWDEDGSLDTWRPNFCGVDERTLPFNGFCSSEIEEDISLGLCSHDVAAPISPQAQEVSGFVDFNVSMTAQDLWRLDIANREAESESWKSISSEIRLIHVNTSAGLKLSGSALPAWGFHLMEVVAEKHFRADAVSFFWTVEEHRYWTTEGPAGADGGSQLEDKQTHRSVSFWTKFTELQRKMLTVKQEETEHKYSSTPLEWITMETNIAYWMDKSSNAQIHLIGNPVSWGVANLSLLAYHIIVSVYLVRRRRGFRDLTEAAWQHFVCVGCVCVGGWMMNVLPFLLMEKTLFLYHYLPALTHLHLLTPALLEHTHNHLLSSLTHQRALRVCAAVALLLILCSYWFFSPLTYGCPELSANQLQVLRWRNSWDFLLRRQ
ncbi:protein O-mannosyl-transferase 1 isoform X2 [Gouania willdenowi]|uniref:protein O-mannosyl-transferase 1 isoform X2 n=1 Tax=Gouania willdenowi TaxID=441366 RepID=UPI00105676BD|nr:protein O-mannosyl-transferase 1 isoform X2 [Gouania willdenowi]